MKLRLLDLCCGGGGCSVGYYRSGFMDITGVDIVPMPRYPYRFVQANAFDYLVEHGHKYDMIHVSPKCQAHTILGRAMTHDVGYFVRHVDQIAEFRKLLIATGKPYVIENVVGAPLDYPIMLCGSMFGLKVYRHRLFESNIFILMPPHIAHNDQTPRSGRGKSPKGFISVTGNGGAAGLGESYLAYASRAMGIDWMSRAELSQAIPPAYTQWIGERLMEVIQ